MADYDVIVLGTGAAGLTAAVTAAELGARVGLFEKNTTIGGTTVYSGGMIWIPLNQHEPPEKGDTREKALDYLHELSNDTISDEMAETYIDVGPEMVRWLDERTPLKFRPVPDFPDYHPEQRGGLRQGGRSLETAIYPYGELGEWGDRVHCLDRGVEPQTDHRAVELIMENGEVAGVVFETPAGPEEVHAPNVVIATGGFERNPDLKRAFLRGPCTHAGWSSTRSGSTSTASRAASGEPPRPGPTGSHPPTRSRASARSWASRATCSLRPSSASTPTHATCTIPTSSEAGALRTSGRAIRMTYGGAGGTLGPAMVFGYLAGRDIARRVAAPDAAPLAAAHGGA